MKLNDQLQDILLKINEKLPPQKRAEFVGRIRERFRSHHIRRSDRQNSVRPIIRKR